MRLSFVAAMPFVLLTACFHESPPPATTTVVTTAAQPATEAQGTLVKVSGSQLQLSQGGVPFTLNTSNATLVSLNGVPSSVGALHPGADIRASYTMAGGHAVAIRIDATGTP